MTTDDIGNARSIGKCWIILDYSDYYGPDIVYVENSEGSHPAAFASEAQARVFALLYGRSLNHHPDDLTLLELSDIWHDGAAAAVSHLRQYKSNYPNHGAMESIRSALADAEAMLEP